MKRNLYVDKQVKAENEQSIYIVDLLNTAINTGKQVYFKYYEYNQQKRKIYKHKGKVYRFSPYSLIWNNDCYYILGFSESHDKIVKFRVERIANCELTEVRSIPKPKDFNLERYSKSVFQMYDEEIRIVTLICDNSMMKTIVDRFGSKVQTSIVSKAKFKAVVEVSVSNTFFGWVVGHGGQMDIAAPEDVREKYHTLLHSLIL